MTGEVWCKNLALNMPVVTSHEMFSSADEKANLTDGKDGTRIKLLDPISTSETQWANIQIERSTRIREIYITNYNSNNIENAFFHVGDNADPTLNPKCSEAPLSGLGIYECNLAGNFVGISRVCSNSAPLALYEMLVF